METGGGGRGGHGGLLKTTQPQNSTKTAITRNENKNTADVNDQIRLFKIIYGRLR